MHFFSVLGLKWCANTQLRQTNVIYFIHRVCFKSIKWFPWIHRNSYVCVCTQLACLFKTVFFLNIPLKTDIKKAFITLLIINHLGFSSVQIVTHQLTVFSVIEANWIGRPKVFLDILTHISSNGIQSALSALTNKLSLSKLSSQTVWKIWFTIIIPASQTNAHWLLESIITQRSK